MSGTETPKEGLIYGSLTGAAIALGACTVGSFFGIFGATVGWVCGLIAAVPATIAGYFFLLSAVTDWNTGRSDYKLTFPAALTSMVAAAALTTHWVTGYTPDFMKSEKAKAAFSEACKPIQATLANGTAVVMTGANCPNAPKQ